MMKPMRTMSIVLPAYNEEKNISLSYHTISELLTKNKIPFELIYVNDGSKDKTWYEIEKIKSNTVLGLSFSRNFGKEAAILAGLNAASGACVVVMDCDLQHNPEALVEMYQLWCEGYEVVEGVKINRGKESLIHKLFSCLFYTVMTKIMGYNMRNTSDYKLLDRKVVDEIIKLPEKNRFFRALSFWVGFKQTTVEYEVLDRLEGETKWRTSTLIKYAINNITSFSTIPLHIVTWTGVLYLLFAFILGGYVLTQYFLKNSLEGFTTVIVLILMVGSTMSVGLGIVGLYIGKIYQELKGRPTYIISDTSKKISMDDEAGENKCMLSQINYEMSSGFKQ